MIPGPAIIVKSSEYLLFEKRLPLNIVSLPDAEGTGSEETSTDA